MGTKQLGWPTSVARGAGGPCRPRTIAGGSGNPVAKRFAARFLALSAVTAIVTLSTSPAWAIDPRKARDRIVELNKQALLSYEAKDFETARDLLTKALKEAKAAGLEDDKMTARTYLHLGAVYWVGFQDQAVAIQNFSLSKKIRPDIQLTPSIETADLKSVFDLATVEAEPTGPAASTASSKAQSRPTPDAETRLVAGEGGGEPDLPNSYPAPLMCTIPPVVPPNREQTLRCALKPGLRAKVVQIHYRAPGVESYQSLGMRKTAKGWYLVTLPSSVMKSGSLQVYFEARDGSGNEVASNGQVDSPSIIEVKKKRGGRIAGECPEDDPMCKIRRQAREDKYEAGLHRRREGAIWFGVGGGFGFGFVPGGPLEWRKSIKVSAVTAPLGMFHVIPEIGYMWTDHFAIAGQAIIEFIKQEQLAGETGPIIEGSPANMGAAGLARALYYIDLFDGNLQFSMSGDLGGGFLRIPVKPNAQGEWVENPSDPDGPLIHDPKLTIFRTDTRPIGIVVLGAGAGFIWHPSRHLGVALEGRFLTGMPNFGAVFEGSLSFQLAFGGLKGPPKAESEEDEEEVEIFEEALPGESTTEEEEMPLEDLGPEE
jgi:hypothetical protein